MLRKKKIITKRAARERKACLPGRQGQSTIEYIILVVIVIAAALAFRTSFQTRIGQTVTDVSDGMRNMAGRLNASRP